MDTCVISLFGSLAEVGGWRRLLDQEGAPYAYKGTVVDDVSRVNIVVGSAIASLKPSSNNIFILEPGFKFFEGGVLIKNVSDPDLGEFCVHTVGDINLIEGRPFAGKFRLYEAFCDLDYPLVSKNRNNLIFTANVSSLLNAYGFGFRPVESRLIKDSQLVSWTDNAQILRMMKKVLLEAFSMAEEPYVHLWYYPEGKPSTFLFRQDVDYVDQVGIDALAKVTKKYGIRGTYFVNMSGEEEYEDEVGCKKLKKPITPRRIRYLMPILKEGNELASHGYWHDVFPTKGENLKDLALCDRYFERLFGFKPVGYASPGGVWHWGLAEALEERSFLYACCGCLGHQGFPCFPTVFGRRTGTLEVPFDLISDAIFEDGCDDKKLARLLDYYLNLIDIQIARSEPIAIAGHPHCLRDRALEFYSPVFQKAREKEVAAMTVREWAEWWLARARIPLDKKPAMISNRADDKVWVETVSKKGRSLMSLETFWKETRI